MCDSTDCVKNIERQTSRSTQELNVWDFNITNNKIPFNFMNSKRISDFWGIRR